jgi:hypothetical protein
MPVGSLAHWACSTSTSPRRGRLRPALCACAVLLGCTAARAEDTEALAKASQNPVSDLISVPFQNNTNFHVGPFDRRQNQLNIEPVIPLHVTPQWNVISRTIAPVLSQPDTFFDSSTDGLGDINESLFLTPAHPGPLILGFGPIVTAPTATSQILGTGKWLLGPTAVAVTMPGHWVTGVLVNNQWSVAGDGKRPSVNAFYSQVFVNYNLPEGWFLTAAPIITADWTAAADQRWTVPFGGGVGKLFKLGDQSFSGTVQAYYNAVHPDDGPDWQLRAQLSALFPTK